MTATDANGNTLTHGDKVYALDFDGSKIYVTFQVNNHPVTKHFYDWSVMYDDCEECIVLDFNQLWKALPSPT